MTPDAEGVKELHYIWSGVSSLGLKGNESDELRKYILLVNRITLLVCLLTPAFIPFLLICGDGYYALIQAGFSCLFPFAFLFSHKGWYRLTAVYLYLLLLSNLTLASLLNKDIGSEYLLLPTALTPFMMFRNMSESFSMFILVTLDFFIVQVMKPGIRPAVELPEHYRLLLFNSILIMTFFICALLIYTFKKVIDGYERSILKQKELIEERNQEIMDSIRYAKRIQGALLPTEKYITRKMNTLQEAQANYRQDEKIR